MNRIRNTVLDARVFTSVLDSSKKIKYQGFQKVRLDPDPGIGMTIRSIDRILVPVDCQG